MGHVKWQPTTRTDRLHMKWWPTVHTDCLHMKWPSTIHTDCLHMKWRLTVCTDHLHMKWRPTDHTVYMWNDGPLSALTNSSKWRQKEDQSSILLRVSVFLGLKRNSTSYNYMCVGKKLYFDGFASWMSYTRIPFQECARSTLITNTPFTISPS